MSSKSQNTKQKINNQQNSTNFDDNFNINELLKNINNNNDNYVEQSYDVITALINENELYRNEAFGFKYVSDELQEKLKKISNEKKTLFEENNNLKQNNEKLNNQMNLYEKQQKGGFSDNILKFLKCYSTGLTEDKKRELRDKYKKYIPEYY